VNKMTERRIIVDGLTVKYKGYFHLEELYKLIDHWTREKAYTKHELNNTEQVFKDGRFITLELEPYKKITDYAKYVIQIKMTAKEMKDVTVEKDGRRVALNDGTVELKLTGFLELDYEGRWEKKPLFYFLRNVFDQFVFKTNTEVFEAGLVEEVNQIYSIVKGFLNLHRY
jgi:hypothetical protein